MTKVVDRFSEVKLAESIDANILAYWTTLNCLPPGEQQQPHCYPFATNIDDAFYNGVVSARFPTKNIKADMEQITNFFTSKRLPMTWWIGPTTRPLNLSRYLKKHGLILGDSFPGMASNLLSLEDDNVLPPGFRIKTATTTRMLKLWCRTFGRGFGSSDIVTNGILDLYGKPDILKNNRMFHYIGFLHEEAVATSTLFLGGDVAGIWDVSTIPSARRMGVGRAMTLTPLLDARGMGYRIGVLASTDMGIGVYKQLGFREYCRIEHYILQVN